MHDLNDEYTMHACIITQSIELIWNSLCHDGTCFKMSENENIRIKSRYKCLECNKRTQKFSGSSGRIFLSSINSGTSKKIRDFVLKGRTPKFDDVLCNKCKQRLTIRLKKGNNQVFFIN